MTATCASVTSESASLPHRVFPARALVALSPELARSCVALKPRPRQPGADLWYGSSRRRRRAATRTCPGPRPRTTIPHLPAIDGLRGLAVLGVLLFHDGHLRGGYLGVDLFFVLSGYLITSLLLAEWSATGGIALGTFWVRRARRLFPALLALVPVVALYAATLAQPAELARIRADGLGTLAYVANWHSIFAGQSYWALFSAPSPLEHTWSLAIEEQFYVVWPLLVLLVLWRSRGSARVLLVVSVVFAVLSAVAMSLLYNPEDTSRAYLGTDTRAAAILAGVALACVTSTWGTLQSARAVRALDAVGIVSLVALGAAWALLDGKDSRLYHGGFWATEVAVLALIACAAHDRRSVVARALALRPFVAVGLISYGVYLWHWPLYVVLSKERLGFGGGLLTSIRLAATFAVSLLSYRFLEQPIRKNGLRFGKPILVVPAALAFAVVTLVVSTRGGLDAGGSSRRHRSPIPAHRARPGGRQKGPDFRRFRGDEHRRAAPRNSSGSQDLDRGSEGSATAASCTTSCLLSPSTSASRWRKLRCKVESDVAELHPDTTLVVLGGGFFAPVQIDKKWQRPCDQGFRKAYREELTRKLEAIRPSAGRVLLTVVPYPVGIWTDATPEGAHRLLQ